MPDAVQAKQQILAALESGPQLPKDIQQKMQPKVDSFLLGALLSELTGSKQVKNTFMKIGSSSIHYLPKHAEQLQEYADRLKGPEKEGYEQLVQKKLLPLETLEPRVRVSLDNVKDFAKKISITYEGKEHLFYRWYLLSDEETKEMITSYLHGASKKEIPETQGETVEEPVSEPVQEDHEPEEPPEEVLEEKEPETEEEPEPEPEVQKKEQPEEPKKEESIKEKEPVKEEKKPEPKDQDHSTSPLMQRLKEKGMHIDHYKMINKKDMLFEGTLSTSFGPLRCRVIVKKKKVTDADLVECMKYKEDVLVVLCNDVSKKAEKNAAQLGILLEEL